MGKATWSRPRLLRKPVNETAQGNGQDLDAIGGEAPRSAPTS